MSNFLNFIRSLFGWDPEPETVVVPRYRDIFEMVDDPERLRRFCAGEDV